MASDVIDFVLQKLVEQDIFQGIPKWELLKDYLVRECVMAPDLLETRRGEIAEKFVCCKREQWEQGLHDLIGTTSNKTTRASADRVSMDQVMPESAGLEQRPYHTKDAGAKGEEEVSEHTFHPKIDEKLSVSAS
jgi:hypothetical protein